MKYEQHELSAAFPSMLEGDLQALAHDIKENGLHSPVVMYQGKVLDGWHRVGACAIAGVNVRAIDYKGKNPVAFVKSHNWHRRHMTESQKAMTQVRLSEWRPSGVTSRSAPGADLPPTSAEMAKEAGVSERTINSAKVVEKNGTDTLKTAVLEGEISVKKAAAVAKKPKAQQAKALKEAKEPKPKKAKVKPVKPAPEEDYSVDLAKELESAATQITNLQAVVESLKKSDLAAEVLKWRDKFERLDGRLQQCVTSKNEAEKQARYSTGLLAKIRAALKVEKNSEILTAIRQ